MKNVTKMGTKIADLKKVIRKRNPNDIFKFGPGLTKTHIKKAMAEHHALGNIIGAAVRSLGKGFDKALPYIGIGGKVLGSLGGGSSVGNLANATGTLAQTGLDFKKMNRDNRTAAAQERLLRAQARGAENQNAYLEKQMAGSQLQKKGGLTKSCRKKGSHR